MAKQAAQGAALLADGLAGGRAAPLVEAMGIRDAGGTVLDHLYVISQATARARLGITIVRVLVAGVSTRAAAESAARAGFAVTAIDAFGDLDQHRLVRVVSLEGAFTARAAARAARSVECDAVVYLANFENHPNAVRRSPKAVRCGATRRRSSAACAIPCSSPKRFGSAVFLRHRSG